MPFVDNSPLNYPVNTTVALPIRREERAPIDDQDGLKYRLLTIWHDLSSSDVYMLANKTRSTTTWVLIGGTGGGIETVTGDVGGAVPPDAANNINLISDASLTVTGAPGTFTLTISSTNGQLVTKFLPDSGTSPVVPDSAGEVTITGGNGMTTIGGLNQWNTEMQSPFTGDFTFEQSNDGGDQTLSSSNTSNTAGSNAKVEAKVAGTSGGDPFLHLPIGTARTYALGADNDATNRALKLVSDASGSTNPSTGTSQQEWDAMALTSNFTTTGALKVHSGTEAQRPVTPLDGMVRNNTDAAKVEFYEDGDWRFLGRAIQLLSTSTSALIDATTVIPSDDTIPKQTEGDEILTLAITPTDSTNVLLVLFTSGGQITAAGGAANMALFQDATANAVAAQAIAGSSGGTAERYAAGLSYSQVAGTASATTFKIRMGPTGAGSLYINGAGGTREFGGVSATELIIIEVEV